MNDKLITGITNRILALRESYCKDKCDLNENTGCCILEQERGGCLFINLEDDNIAKEITNYLTLDNKEIEKILLLEFEHSNMMSKELCFHVAKFISNNRNKILKIKE